MPLFSNTCSREHIRTLQYLRGRFGAQGTRGLSQHSKLVAQVSSNLGSQLSSEQQDAHRGRLAKTVKLFVGDDHLAMNGQVDHS